MYSSTADVKDIHRDIRRALANGHRIVDGMIRNIKKLMVVLVVALGARLVTTPSEARPQTPSGAPGTTTAAPSSPTSGTLPDIVGFRPGVSFQEAHQRLKAYHPKGRIDVGQVQIPELGDRRLPATLLFTSPVSPGLEVPEIIQLELTLPPEPPVVWGILRRLFFEAGKEMTRPNLLAALRRQYGPENHGITIPIVNLYWAFDEQGRRAETGRETYTNCALPGAWDISLNRGATGSRSSAFPASSLLLGRPVPNQGPCKPLVYVKALLQPSGPRGLELIESSTVTVINGALAARAQAATAAYRATALEAQKKTGTRKVQQPPKPRF